MCGLKLKHWVTHKSVCTIIIIFREITIARERERERNTKLLNAEIGGREGKKG